MTEGTYLIVRRSHGLLGEKYALGDDGGLEEALLAANRGNANRLNKNKEVYFVVYVKQEDRSEYIEIRGMRCDDPDRSTRISINLAQKWFPPR